MFCFIGMLQGPAGGNGLWPVGVGESLGVGSVPGAGEPPALAIPASHWGPPGPTCRGGGHQGLRARLRCSVTRFGTGDEVEPAGRRHTAAHARVASTRGARRRDYAYSLSSTRTFFKMADSTRNAAHRLPRFRPSCRM